MRYHRLGRVPPKRHIQHRENGTLLREELLGYEGFAGNESTLYHLEMPTRVKEVGAFTPLQIDDWVPGTQVHRLVNTQYAAPEGDAVLGRRILMHNDDVQMSICVPTAEADYFYRNGEGDEVLFVHEGGGVLESVYGTLPFRRWDYVVIPRGTTYRLRFDGPQRWLCFFTPGEVQTPRRYRNEFGHLLESAPFSHRDFHPPEELVTNRERGSFDLKVRARGGFQDFELDYHPLDVVGWDGFVYPFTFNIMDFEPRTGLIHLPPPTHQTFEGQNFVICSFCPRQLDYHPESVPVPYWHSNIQSEEVLYYVDGQFGSRAGVDVGSITLHPSGLPHGPQPGRTEASLGKTRTEELAVMCDTFYPLRLTTLVEALDDPSYAKSWYEPYPAEDAPTS
jgi:homogentisate 1,2-dioxygenase